MPLCHLGNGRLQFIGKSIVLEFIKTQ